MDPFVDQLARMCRSCPTRAKWVFVPSHATGRTLGDRLVLAGTDWANLRFVTPFDIAVRMGAPFLVERGINPSEEGLGPALIMRLLLGLDADRAAYFRPLAHQPPMALALWTTLRELRLAGVRAASLSGIAFASTPKRDELQALLDAYESFLHEHQRGDMATIYEEAIQHPDWCPIQPPHCWTELPDAIWPPLARRLIDTMPGERIVPDAFDLPGAAMPRRLAIAPVNRLSPPASAPLAFLMAPQPVPAPASAAPPSKPRAGGRAARAGSAVAADTRQLSLLDAEPAFVELSAVGHRPDQRLGAGGPDLFHAGSAEAEVEEVFRRVLTVGTRLDDVEIVCASASYATLIWEKALRHDWPITLSGGVPAALTRPGRALIALADWIEDDFSAGLLRRLLQSGDIRLPDDMELAPARAARMLVRAQAAWGRDTYRLSLGRLAKAARTRAERDDLMAEERERLRHRAAQADALAAWIASLIDAIPMPDRATGQIDLQALAAPARRFVADCASRASALDVAAATSLASAIEELQALGKFRCTLEQALRFLRERVDRVAIGADRARPGHLHVSTLPQAGFAHRRRVFVVGLEEGRVFPSPFEDPILLDIERSAIHPGLAQSNDRTDEAVMSALARLAAVSARPDVSITLSYSCRDTREFRPTYASWLMLQAYRVVSGDPRASYKMLHDALGPPVSCVPPTAGAATDLSRWWLAGVTRAGAAAREAVLGHYRWLAAGVRAEDARRSDRFTEYDGHVPAAGAVLDPCGAGAVVSATQLEEAAQCPFRFFLRRGLQIDAIDSGDRDRDAWLDPLIRGSLLHDLYADLLRRCRDEHRRATLPGDADWLRARGEEALATLAREMPPPSAEIHDRESRAFLDDLMLFVTAEAQLSPDREPVAFEVAFGRSGISVHEGVSGTDAEPLAQADPIEVDLGGGLGFRLAGRIDRIDRIGPSTFEIIDYKTGGYWEKDWQGTFAGGTRLQHALYGLAALALLKRQDANARVIGAHYYFSSGRGHQERKTIPAPAPAMIARVLGDLRQVIAAGVFVHARDEGACKWCDFGQACGVEAPVRAAAKVTDAALGPYLRLVAHD